MGDEKLKQVLEGIENNFDDKFEVDAQVRHNQKLEQIKKNLGTKIGAVYDKKELARELKELQPFFYDKGKNWWLWDWHESKWVLVDETDVLNAVDRQVTINSINSKEKTEILEAMKQVGRSFPPGKIKKTWIQFCDTIVDIETGKEFRATPDYFVTNPIPHELDVNKFQDTPVMDEIFKEWVGEENINVLYEILAYCLLPDYPIHRVFCFIGAGLNGKGCFLRLLAKFLGLENVCSTELDTLLTSRFEITRLHKKLACLMGETNFNEMNKTSILKKLTGGDLIGFEYKNKNPFEDENYAKIIIATNNLPTTTDKTIGFYRRWMIIDFPNQFSEKEDILAKIPQEEYNALAMKCVFILKDLLQNRAFTNEGSVEDRIKKYEDHSNPLEKFLREFTIEDYNSIIWKWEFSERLKQWCKENRFREISDVVIGKKMNDLNIGQKLVTHSGNLETKRWRAWIGIKWKLGDNNENDD